MDDFNIHTATRGGGQHLYPLIVCLYTTCSGCIVTFSEIVTRVSGFDRSICLKLVADGILKIVSVPELPHYPLHYTPFVKKDTQVVRKSNREERRKVIFETKRPSGETLIIEE
jgi:hypothetical protein